MRPIHRTCVTAAALTATIALTSPPAHAVDVGWCGTPEEMSALMREEGQRSLAVGNQHIAFEIDDDGEIHGADRFVGLILTADLDGRVGYLIQADQPMGTPSTRSCIALRFHDVRLYDARQPGVPDETLIDSTEEAALARCAAIAETGLIAVGSCGFHNTAWQASVRVGEGMLLQAYSTTRRSDGSYATDDGLITVTLIGPGNGRDREGERSPERDGRGVILVTALPEGAMIITTVFVDGAYTQHALDLLASRREGIQSSALLQPR